MARMRHPTMSFNFTPPGEPFETAAEDVEYLRETYGCELVEDLGESQGPPPDQPEVAAVPDPDPPVEDPQAEVYAVPKAGGWYEMLGKSYRRSQLPPDVEILEPSE